MEIGSKKRIKFRVGVAAIGANLYQDKVDGVGESLRRLRAVGRVPDRLLLAVGEARRAKPTV